MHHQLGVQRLLFRVSGVQRRDDGLFQFGTGPIRGFATTLFFGLLSNVFTAVFVSRTLFELILSRRPQAAKLSI